MWTRKSAGKKWFVRWNRPLPKTQSWILSCKMSGKLEILKSIWTEDYRNLIHQDWEMLCSYIKKKWENDNLVSKNLTREQMCALGPKGKLLFTTAQCAHTLLASLCAYTTLAKKETFNSEWPEWPKWQVEFHLHNNPLYASWWMCIEVTWPPNILLR